LFGYGYGPILTIAKTTNCKAITYCTDIPYNRAVNYLKNGLLVIQHQILKLLPENTVYCTRMFNSVKEVRFNLT